MEFTNTFENGLHKDSNILLQPKGTYRDMQNGMLVSYDGNHYVVELPKGTRVSFTIPPIYDEVYTSFATIPTPIGFISFLDKLVVFSTNSKVNAQTGGYGEIGLVEFDKDGTGTYEALYNSPFLNFSIFHQITGFTFEENDKIRRVYWTDNFNQPGVINTADPAFAPVATGSLTVGVQYAVTGGAITHNGIDYGPGLTAGNVFTAANANYTVLDGSPIVRLYVDYHLLTWTPDRINPEIDFNKAIAGSLFGGSKSYFVRLSVKSQGIQTSWSYGSFPINVYSISQYSSYAPVEGNGAGGVLQATSTGVELRISGIDTIYDTIEVAVAEFNQTSNVLSSAFIFAVLPITGSTMLIQHTSETGTALTLNDLTLFPANIFNVKDITTNKNYSVIGNISEREELEDLNPTTATISDLVYTIPADRFSGPAQMNAGLDKQPSTGVLSGNIVPDGKYVVSGGVIQYAGNQYGPATALGIYFTGAFGATTYIVISGTPVVKACILIKRYQSQSGFDRWKAIELNDDFFDYRGMAATEYLRQYWSTELYRFAVIPYDKKGNPMYARWIGDKQIQTFSNKGGPIKITGNYASLQVNGISLSGLEFTAADIAKISGFSIVRAPRDKQCLAQGIFFQTVGAGSGNPGVSGKVQTQPLAQIGLSNDYASEGGNFQQVFNWYSPDQLLGYSGYTGGAGNYFEGEYFLGNAGSLYEVNGINEQRYTKFYTNAGSRTQSIKIDRYDVVNPGGSITSYINGIDYDNNNLHLAGFAPFAAGGHAVGGRGVIATLAGFPQFPSGAFMGDASEQNNPAKPLINYKLIKNNLYGGQSPQALANTIYVSTGHYQPIDASVLADTFNAGTGTYIFNDIEVFGGDSFLGIFDFGHSLYDNVQYSPSFSYGIFYPVESSVNHYLRQGRHIGKDGMQNNSNGVVYNSGGTSRPEEFGMNDSYASDASIIAYPALPQVAFSSRFPYRVRWAGAKVLGEAIDSFRIYFQNNFRDLDGNKGEINNLRNRDGKVFYWQNHGIGYLPILERVTVAGAVGEATQLGVGGVIDRFDDFNTYFGNQHKFGLIDTEYGFAWFDFRRRAFLVMTVGGGIQEVSFVKGLQTFFNDPALFYASQLTDSDYELQDNDTPLLGIGISGVYDPMYKMTYMNFKWVEGEDEVPTTWKEFTIGYHHPRNVFVGFFDIRGAIWQSHNNWLVAAKNINYATIQALTDYSIGDRVSKDNVEYVAIVNFTTHNPVQSYEQPDAAGSVYWAKTTQTNEVNLLFSTTAFCKFFGYTYNHSIELVINPKTGKPFTVDNFRQKSNSVNYDVVECEVDDDSSIESTNNRFYRYIDKFWQSSVALGTKGRLVDAYLKVKLTLNNYTNNPTNSRNLQKVFEFITSVFREKR
jgi:hypothetical protein